MLTEVAFDSASSDQVTAAIIAAVAAVVLALFNLVVTIWQGSETRRVTSGLADREQWWDRFTWAAEELWSEDEDQALVAVEVLSTLGDVEWVTEGDRKMINRIFDLINSDVYEPLEESYAEDGN